MRGADKSTAAAQGRTRRRVAAWLGAGIMLLFAVLLLAAVRQASSSAGAVALQGLPSPRGAGAASAPVNSAPGALPARRDELNAVSTGAQQHAPEAGPPNAVLDLCGVGRMPMPLPNTPAAHPETIPAFAEKLPDALGLHPMRDAWARVRDTLLAGGDTQRAWALALETSTAMVSDGTLMEGWGRSPATRAAMLALAEQAQASTEATPLRLALELCGRRPYSVTGAPGSPSARQGVHSDPKLNAACDALDANSLAERDPLDAYGWLLRAATATEPQARREALERAAAAPRLTGLHLQAPQRVVQAWPAEQPAYLRMELSVRAIGAAQALESLEAPAAALRFCRAADPAAADGAQADLALCDRLARLFLERSNTAQLAMFGPTIGRRAGWPEAEVQSMRRKLMDLMDAGNRLVLGQTSAWSCEAIAAFEQHLATSARDGELSALRALQAAQRTESNTMPKPAQNAPQAGTAAGDLPPRR